MLPAVSPGIRMPLNSYVYIIINKPDLHKLFSLLAW